MIKAMSDGGVCIGVEETDDNGLTHRRVVTPGSYVAGVWTSTDLSLEPQEVLDLEAELWTEEAVQDFKQRIYIPPRTPTQADYAAAIQQHVDSTAQSRQYDNGNSLASYVGSTVPQWAAEAIAFVTWRDAVWVYANAQLAKVQSGERVQPSVQELASELPSIVWP